MDDLLREASILEKAKGEGFTTRELAKQSGCSSAYVLERLKELAEQNRIVTGWRDSKSIDGRRCKVPVYRVVAGKKSKGSVAARA